MARRKTSALAAKRPRPLPSVERVAVKPRQNWVLSPFQDGLFIIAAPVLVLALALVAFLYLGPVEGTSCIIVSHVILTVAHHLPTFIRIYGDVDLFRRFKWSFIFGPLIPFAVALGAMAYINLHHYPVENFYYLLIILALWDPWHFLMQHYGFMRIYDRPNAAPRPLAAPMDLALCASWFAYIMLASGSWLPGILNDLYSRSHLPAIFAVPMGALPVFSRIALGTAIVVTGAYLLYLGWCRKKGYYVSSAKLALFIVTFAVMGLTYTPNSWILRVAPGWTFKVGFAVLGIVHVTQYLAIVWRYNRGLVARADRARPGLFLTLHKRGGWLVAGAYVVVCIAYGDFLTTVHTNRWLMSVLLATGFTSTLMHYYFDGFIWKVRHKQNVENLAIEESTGGPNVGPAQALTSWWASVREVPAYTIFFRQMLYFGLPMAALSIGAWTVWTHPSPNYLVHVKKADEARLQGRRDESLNQAELALADIDDQLRLARKVTDLEPTSSHESELAELIYMYSVTKRFVIPPLRGERLAADCYREHLEQVEQAIDLLEKALSQGGSLGYPGRENMTANDAQRSLTTWQKIAGQCRAKLAASVSAINYSY